MAKFLIENGATINVSHKGFTRFMKAYNKRKIYIIIMVLM